MDDYLRSACKSLPSSEHQSSIPHSRRPQCSISTIDTARSDLRLTYHGRETLPDSWGFCSQKILLTEKAVVSVIRYVSNSYAVCGHIMVTHRAFVRKALPNLNSQGPKSWKSPIYSDIYDSIFTSARQGFDLSHFSPGIVPNDSDITDPKANEQKLRHAGHISYPAFTGIIGALFGVAVLIVAARIGMRWRLRRRLYLDDFFLIFGLACLCGATGIILVSVRKIFLTEAILVDQSFLLTKEGAFSVANTAPAIINSFLVLTWTVVISVKFSFLALFRLLIQRISWKITIYYWFVVVFTVITWIYMVSEAFIVCPAFGVHLNSKIILRCMAKDEAIISLILSILLTILDIATDTMIVSIPIIILQKSQMKPKQQLGLSIFLCLSVIMTIIAIIRISGYRFHGVGIRGPLDSTWAFFWLYLEACVAVIMSSITSFRSLFIHGSSKTIVLNENQNPMDAIRERISRRAARYGWDEVDEEPRISNVNTAHTGIETIIYHKEPLPETTAPPIRSKLYSWDEDEDSGKGMKPEKIERTDQIYVNHRVEIHSDRVSLSDRDKISINAANMSFT